MSDLFFDDTPNDSVAVDYKTVPLAAAMRPNELDDIIGQEHLLARGKLLWRTIQADKFTSVIFYGPPGSGKTSLAHVISRVTHSQFVSINAADSNLAELRKMIDKARKLKQSTGERMILFIDEIHRFNRSQQDALMPDVENGNVILIGATTHNPSFVVNGPLLSRALIFELKPLSETQLVKILQRALQDKERGFGKLKIKADDEALKHIAVSASGDARKALTALEVAVITTPAGENDTLHLTAEVAAESCQRRVVYHDRDGDYHYDVASAFIKSMRGSDPDAAVYWLAKMLYAGEDPRFIIRRILILASEDIGNADPQALILAASGLQAVEFVGMPEAQIILSQLVTYMALAPKSNASYAAIQEASADVREEAAKEVPNHLRDKHYKGAKRLGHGEGYKYPHDYPGHFVRQSYGADSKAYYRPATIGFEKILSERLSKIKPSKPD